MAEHESGLASHHKELWTLLVFQLWHDNFLRGRPLTSTEGERNGSFGG
jgi:hypothetical protein